MRLALVTLLACSSLVARAELPNKSPAQLRAASTDVVYGTVMAIYERTVERGGWRTTNYVAEVAAHGGLETGAPAGELVYVRYWRKAWTGASPAPAGSYGHHFLPRVGEALRFYLARRPQAGPGDDLAAGGLDVVLPNGFERLKPSR